jgi:hypothetical protein
MIDIDDGIDNVVNNLRDYDFGSGIDHNLIDYLSCRIHEDYKSQEKSVMQAHLIKNLEGKFGEEANNLNEYGTPGTLKFKIVRPGDNIERIDSNFQAKYRSGVGIQDQI